MLNDDVSLYELYHENSKLNPITEQEMSLRIGALYEDPGRLHASRTAIKVYPYAKRVELPNPPVLHTPFADVVSQRRSRRRFSTAPVSLSEISYLMRYGNGVTGELKISETESQTLRAAPSAGALYPIEIYLMVLRAGELDPGIYHYRVAGHSLELVRHGEFRSQLARAMPAQFNLDTAPLVVMLSAAFDKTTHKYGERGYRFVLFDAGHVMQNLALAATALGLGGYPVGGFREDELDALLGLDGLNEASLYAAVLGHPVEQVDGGTRET